MLARQRKWYENSLLIGVMGSLIAGLILQPLLGGIVSWVLNHTGPFLQTVRDAGYANAPNNLVARQVSLFKTLLYFGIIASLVLSTSMLYAIQRLRLNPMRAEKPYEKTVVSKLSYVIRLSSPFIIVLALGMGIVDFTVDDISRLAKDRFERNITIILPYIDNVQERNFRAQFASVHSEADFRSLSTSISAIAKSKSRALVPWNV